ncbi:TPA: hypothetical protein L6A81_12330 [Pseudomonas aeruginosa]|nr:hypothetical protein [Pseudomonas aeruginosa]
MTKTAVQVDLVCLDDPIETMRFHGVLSEGKLVLPEMYCHLYEWYEKENDYVVQPGILNDEDGNCRYYVGEWGYGDKSSVVFDFLDRPLAEGQEVIRTDKVAGETSVYTYRITAITDLLA